MTHRLHHPATFDTYIKQIDHPLLKHHQELDLARRIKGDDQRDAAVARDELIIHNLRLVVRIARNFLGRGLPIEDLVAEGNLGLIRAVEGFDPEVGTRFSTYASYWIKQSIQAALNNAGRTVRIPSRMVTTICKWHKAERELEHRLKRQPEFDEVADHIGLTYKQRDLVVKAMATSNTAPVMAEHDNEPQFLVKQTEFEALDMQDHLELLRARMSRLDERERDILYRRYYTKKETLASIGRQYGITKEWVRKIEMTALKKLASPAEHRADPAHQVIAS